MLARIAIAPGSWGVEPTNFEIHPPWVDVLDEIADAGYRGTELGPLGFLPPPATLGPALDQRGLHLVAGYVMEPLTTTGLVGPLGRARRTCVTLEQLGARTLIVIDGLRPERSATAGRSDQARRADSVEWQRLVGATKAVAELALAHGLRPVFHPHAGTYVEFEDEVDRLLAAIEPELLGLCLDTGHCVYAGIDPLALVRREAGRVEHVHLKDVDPERHAVAVASGLSFEDAVASGVFCSLGDGLVDLGAFTRELTASGYPGWVTVEQDRPPGAMAGAKQSAIRSLHHLRTLQSATERASG